MTLYTVLAPGLAPGLVPGTPQAEPDPMGMVFVKEGFCWPALFFAVPWLIFRRLWWVLAGYVVAGAAIMAIGGPLGDGFTGPAGVLFAFLFALEANELRRWTLRRRGYRLAAVVEGRGLEEAEIRYFAGLAGAAPADATPGAPTPPVVRQSPPPPGPPPQGPIMPSAEAGEVIGLFPAPGARA